MAKLLVSESITLDGVFEGPAKAAGETFELAGWTAPYQSEEQNQYLAAGLGSGGALLLGRLTYQAFQTAWMPQIGPVADFMNNATKFVASTTLKQLDWNNSTLLTGTLVEAVAKLKQQAGKDIVVLGSGALCRMLREHELIDEYSLLVFPLVLGRGKRFFAGGGQSPLKLKEAKGFSSGVVLMTYAPERK